MSLHCKGVETKSNNPERNELMKNQTDIRNSSVADMLKWYNANSGAAPVKRFAARPAAEKRCIKLLNELKAGGKAPVAAKPAAKKAAAKKTTAKKTAAKPAAKKAAAKTKGAPADRSAAIKKSWANPATSAKRSERHGVVVDGTGYRSVRAAYEALGFDLADHIPFRMMLKGLNGKTYKDEEGRKWKIVPLSVVNEMNGDA
jgi:hypothetical protein